MYVGFDFEWVCKLVKNVTGHRKVSLVQVAFGKDVYLFYLRKNGLRYQLKALIECNDIVKIVRGVKSDVTRLINYYEISTRTGDKAGYVEVSTKYLNMGYIDRV